MPAGAAGRLSPDDLFRALECCPRAHLSQKMNGPTAWRPAIAGERQKADLIIYSLSVLKVFQNPLVK
jgi:hypothetical protein